MKLMTNTNGTPTKLTYAMIGLLILSGCKAGDFTAAAGSYEGIFVQQAGAKTTQTVITGKVVSTGTLHLDTTLTTIEETPRSWEYVLSANTHGQVSVTDKATGATIALKSSLGSCYINSDAADDASATTRLCYNNNELDINVPSADGGSKLSFTLNRADSDAMPTLETPADFKLSALAKQALTRSFNSQVMFESVVQARLNAQAGYENLIPHVTVGNVISMFTLSTVSFTSLIGFVGNLAPFLIPSNWFHATQAKFQSDAERYAYLLMQANSGNIATGLGYAIVRDQTSLAEMQTELAQITGIRQQVFDEERLGFLPEGSTDSVDSVINSANTTITGLQLTINTEFAGLANAVGFYNPLAIKSVAIDNDLSVDNPDSFDPTQTEALALSRAAELKQMDYLISAAQTNKIETFFDWITPTGGQPLGVGYATFIEIAQAQLEQARVQRQQLQANLLQTIANNINNLNATVAEYKLAQKNITIQNSLVNDYLNQLKLGISVASSDLITAFSGQMAAQMTLINDRFQYLVLRDNMDRELYEGQYAALGASIAPTGPSGN